MSRKIVSVLALALALAGLARAQEGVDAASAQIPKKSWICIRIASLARVDAVAKEITPLLRQVGLDEPAAMLEQMPASALIFGQSGLDAATVDVTKPIYLGFTDDDGDDPVLVFHPAAGAAWDGMKDLKQGFQAVLRGGAVVVAKPEQLAEEPRGTPTTTRGGDIAVHVYLADLVAQNKDDIDEGFAEMAMEGGADPNVPEKLRPMILPAVSAMKGAVYGAESFGYALTWKEGKLWSEGLLKTKEGSGLRAFFAGAGEPGDDLDLLS
jgi:hypothetical protein